MDGALATTDAPFALSPDGTLLAFVARTNAEGAAVARSASRPADGHAPRRDGGGEHPVLLARWTVGGILRRPETEEGSRDRRRCGDARGRTESPRRLVGGGWDDCVRAATARA